MSWDIPTEDMADTTNQNAIRENNTSTTTATSTTRTTTSNVPDNNNNNSKLSGTTLDINQSNPPQVPSETNEKQPSSFITNNELRMGERRMKRGNFEGKKFISAASQRSLSNANETSELKATNPKPSNSVPVRSLSQPKIHTINISGQKVMIMSGIDGKLEFLNELSKKHNLRAIIHTGNFGFYDKNSFETISFDDLKWALEREIGIDGASKFSNSEVIEKVKDENILSQLPLFISGERRLDVPVYTVWGQYEDYSVIEKFQKGIYHVPNLYILDHRNSYAISTGNVALRLFGLGGSFNYRNLFDVGQGNDIISGRNGKVWANLIQMGELLELSNRYDDASETRVFVTQNSPSKEPLVHILATSLTARFTISSSSSSKICSIFNDLSIFTLSSLAAFLKPTQDDLKSMFDQVYFACNQQFTERQKKLCNLVLDACHQSVPKEGECSVRDDCTHINVPVTMQGDVMLLLGKDAINVSSIFELSSKVEERSKEIPKVSSSKPTLVQDFRYDNNPPTTSSPKDSFFIDRSGENLSRGSSSSTKPTRNLKSLFFSSLPSFITGEELDQMLLSSYSVEEIKFVTPKRETALVTFNSIEEAEKALELDQQVISGRKVRVRRDREVEEYLISQNKKSLLD